MTYRTILVEMVNGPSDQPALTATRTLAERFGATPLVMHVAPLPVVPAAYAEPAAFTSPELLAAQTEANEIARRHLRQRLDMPLLELDGERGSEVATAARTADLVVLAAPEATGLDALVATVPETVVVEAGCPTLVLPAGAWARPIGTRVVIGWNGSREAARAMRDALPFMQGAEAVTLLCLDEEGGRLLEPAAAMLARHDVQAAVVHASRDERATGAALLAEAARLGADLLVLGAYGRSRLREMLFGGATRDTMLKASLPILYAA